MDEAELLMPECGRPSLEQHRPLQHVLEQIGQVAKHQWQHNHILHIEDDGDDDDNNNTNGGEEQTRSEDMDTENEGENKESEEEDINFASG